jgi:hypothetical protein
MTTAPNFSTERLQLAIFLHATGRLRFIRCEPTSNHKVRFLFDDPEQVGAEAELEFDRGAPVAGTALFASQKFLRRQMSGVIDEHRKIGAPRYAYTAS